MTHLTEMELVDSVDGVLPDARSRHLESCDRCRQQREALRSAAEAARSGAEDGVPEPSPLFWEHFSQRVHDAVRGAEPLPRPGGWMRAPLAGWAAAAAVAVLGVGAIIWTAASGARLHAPGSPVTAGQETPAGQTTPGADEDAEWALVRLVADDLQWDDGPAAGLVARPGAAEGVALEMSAVERQELVRLIEDELKRRPGA